MAALTQDRNTPRFEGDLREAPVAASQMIHAGALIAVNAAGNVVRGAVATGLIGLGRAEERVDNSAGAAGAATVRYRPGTFRYANSASADAITAADIGKVCFIVDDQTVALTNGSSTRSPAGAVEGVDAQGVWVRMDAALTRALIS